MSRQKQNLVRRMIKPVWHPEITKEHDKIVLRTGVVKGNTRFEVRQELELYTAVPVLEALRNRIIEITDEQIRTARYMQARAKGEPPF